MYVNQYCNYVFSYFKIWSAGRTFSTFELTSLAQLYSFLSRYWVSTHHTWDFYGGLPRQHSHITSIIDTQCTFSCVFSTKFFRVDFVSDIFMSISLILPLKIVPRTNKIILNLRIIDRYKNILLFKCSWVPLRILYTVRYFSVLLFCIYSDIFQSAQFYK